MNLFGIDLAAFKRVRVRIGLFSTLFVSCAGWAYAESLPPDAHASIWSVAGTVIAGIITLSQTVSALIHRRERKDAPVTLESYDKHERRIMKLETTVAGVSANLNNLELRHERRVSELHGAITDLRIENANLMNDASNKIEQRFNQLQDRADDASKALSEQIRLLGTTISQASRRN